MPSLFFLYARELARDCKPEAVVAEALRGRSKMEEWRKDYNEVRPHSTIGNSTPISLINGHSVRSLT